MKTNVKAGDMAITVGMPMDNGLIVDVIEAVSTPGYEHLGPCWHVVSIGSPFHLTPTHLSHKAFIPDFALRPIRDPDGQDETITWDGKPEEVTA